MEVLTEEMSWLRSWLRSCGVAMVFDEMLQRAAYNMNSSFRAFTRHCPCEHSPHGLCCNQKKKNQELRRRL
jgi:hypothetical protein